MTNPHSPHPADDVIIYHEAWVRQPDGSTKHYVMPANTPPDEWYKYDVADGNAYVVINTEYPRD